MAKRSRKQRMRNLSWLFCLIFLGLATAGVVQIRHHDVLTGFELTGSAFVVLAVLIGFTWPTRCRVETRQHKACREDAFGFLFGCSRGHGHWLEKFLIRIRLRRGEMKPLQPRQPAQAFMYQPASQSGPVRVIVEDNARSKLGFWIALISMIAGIGQVALAIVFH
jgi:hypothetical protein